MISASVRKLYSSDVSEEEWAFVAPYLVLMNPSAPQRTYALREVFNGLRYLVKTGGPWRDLPPDLPPWAVVYPQTQRWLRADILARMAQDWREILRLEAGRGAQPTAAILDSRPVPSTPESGARAGYDGAKRRNGTKVHIAVDTLGHLLALHVTPADEQDRAQVGALAAQIQQVTDEHVELAYVDQGDTGESAHTAAPAHGIQLEVVKLPAAKKGFVLLPRRWVVKRSFAWAARFRRLVRDYERLPETVAGLHLVAFACLFLKRLVTAMTPS